MNLSEYMKSLPTKRKLSEVKEKILIRLWGNDHDPFPKPWVSSKELLELTNQKYFDRRARELRDALGCSIETAHRSEFSGHAWRLISGDLSSPKDREYLSEAQKKNLFIGNNYCCSTCGAMVSSGVRGLQADHKIPLSRGGGNKISNWQPMCNNCNVGKRRACEGCNLECKTCSWAFPETFGVRAIVNISDKVLKRVDDYSSKTGNSRDEIMEDAVVYYLDEKD